MPVSGLNEGSRNHVKCTRVNVVKMPVPGTSDQTPKSGKRRSHFRVNPIALPMQIKASVPGAVNRRYLGD